jgi:DNA polymerase-3 subunit alpha/error-prone DNA polymerase
MDKMVVLQPVTFRTKREFNLHKILRIDTNVILSKLTEADYCRTSETMIPLEELLEKFSDYPKLLKIPKASLPNVILNSNLKHLKTKPIIQKVEK